MLEARLKKGTLQWQIFRSDASKAVIPVLCGREKCSGRLGTMKVYLSEGLWQGTKDKVTNLSVDFDIDHFWGPDSYDRTEERWMEVYPRSPDWGPEMPPPSRPRRGLRRTEWGWEAHWALSAFDATWRMSSHAKKRLQRGLSPQPRRGYTGVLPPPLPTKIKCPRCEWINILPVHLFDKAALQAVAERVAEGIPLWRDDRIDPYDPDAYVYGATYVMGELAAEDLDENYGFDPPSPEQQTFDKRFQTLYHHLKRIESGR